MESFHPLGLVLRGWLIASPSGQKLFQPRQECEDALQCEHGDLLTSLAQTRSGER
jgi:hypothetical protein